MSKAEFSLTPILAVFTPKNLVLDPQIVLYCIEFGFNEISTHVGHFVSFPREKEKRDSRDEREGQGRKRNRNESEETEEIKKNIPPLPLPATRIAGLAQL